MRSEIIRCDVCKKEHDAQYVLPTDWITTIQNARHELKEEKHFCSKVCLVKWATEQKPTSEGDRIMFQSGPSIGEKNE